MINHPLVHPRPTHDLIHGNPAITPLSEKEQCGVQKALPDGPPSHFFALDGRAG